MKQNQSNFILILPDGRKYKKPLESIVEAEMYYKHFGLIGFCYWHNNDLIAVVAESN